MHRVIMLWHLVDREGVGLGASLLAQVERPQTRGIAHAHRHAAAQVGQREGRLAIAAIGRAQDRIQRLIARDIQQLALAVCPSARREIAGKQDDRSDKWFHVMSSPRLIGIIGL